MFQVVSFMRNSNLLKRLAKIFVFLALSIFLVGFLNYLVSPRDPDAWQTISQLYEHNDLEVVFLGTSSTYRSNMPPVIDEVAGLRSYNLATPAQSFMASYYLLKEALKSNPVKHVVLHMNISRFQDDMTDHAYQFLAIENMRFSLDKLAFMSDGFTMEKYPDALLRCYRARSLLRLSTIRDNLTPRVVNPEDYPAEVYPYLGKGYSFSANEQIPDEISVGYYAAFNPQKFVPENTEYLQKIIDLCKEKDIDLIFLARPRVAANILATGNYDEFHNYVQALADANQIPFWDFVYLRPDVLTIEDTMFMDAYHPNYRLALPLSRLVGQMLKEHVDGTLDVNQYLYNDYNTFLSQNRRIAGVYTTTLSKKETLKAYAAMGMEKEVEFRFLVSDQKHGGYRLVQDWSTKNLVDLSKLPNKKCWLVVEARQAGSGGNAEQRLRKVVDLTATH